MAAKGDRKEINWEMLELYTKAGCSQTNICLGFHIDEETLRYRVKEKYGIEWSAFSAKLKSEGLMLLEAKQFQKAMSGFWPALQWLGKIKLGQKEQEVVYQLAANQTGLDKDQKIMMLEHENAELKAKNGES